MRKQSGDRLAEGIPKRREDRTTKPAPLADTAPHVRRPQAESSGLGFSGQIGDLVVRLRINLQVVRTDRAQKEK